jgi:D-arabinose 1-dehydrogenase-like Zn-dependent alcohol dehydrogenase
MAKSKAMVATRPGHMETMEYDLPETSAEDGLLKMELVGVCGPDPKIFHGSPSHWDEELILTPIRRTRCLPPGWS